MAEPTAMEMLQKCAREIAWGSLLDFEKRWSTNHWLEDSKLIDMDFDASKPWTVKNYLSQIYNKLPES